MVAMNYGRAAKRVTLQITSLDPNFHAHTLLQAWGDMGDNARIAYLFDNFKRGNPDPRDRGALGRAEAKLEGLSLTPSQVRNGIARLIQIDHKLRRQPESLQQIQAAIDSPFPIIPPSPREHTNKASLVRQKHGNGHDTANAADAHTETTIVQPVTASPVASRPVVLGNGHDTSSLSKSDPLEAAARLVAERLNGLKVRERVALIASFSHAGDREVRSRTSGALQQAQTTLTQGIDLTSEQVMAGVGILLKATARDKRDPTQVHNNVVAAMRAAVPSQAATL